MALDLHEPYKYADPYRTNWAYLHNMAEIQMKLVEEITWDKGEKYIRDPFNLWFVPETWPSNIGAGNSVERFIDSLNTAIMRL